MEDKKTKNLGGRLQFDGKDVDVVVSKLEDAFMWGCSDTEASLYAGISRSALNRYIEKNPGFGTRKEELKKTPSMIAKRNIYTELGAGDVNTARWQLEHRESQDYSKQTKTDLTSGGEALPAIINVVTPPTADYTTEEEIN